VIVYTPLPETAFSTAPTPESIILLVTEEGINLRTGVILRPVLRAFAAIP